MISFIWSSKSVCDSGSQMVVLCGKRRVAGTRGTRMGSCSNSVSSPGVLVTQVYSVCTLGICVCFSVFVILQLIVFLLLQSHMLKKKKSQTAKIQIKQHTIYVQKHPPIPACMVSPGLLAFLHLLQLPPCSPSPVSAFYPLLRHTRQAPTSGLCTCSLWPASSPWTNTCSLPDLFRILPSCHLFRKAFLITHLKQRDTHHNVTFMTAGTFSELFIVVSPVPRTGFCWINEWRKFKREDSFSLCLFASPVPTTTLSPQQMLNKHLIALESN